VPQGLSGPLTRQRTVYRQRVATTPGLLAGETLSRVHVTQVFQETQGQGRAWRFPPSVTRWTLLRQLLRPDGACREAVTRWRAFQVAPGAGPCSPHTGSYGTARGRRPDADVAHLAQEVGPRRRPSRPVPWRWQGRRVKRVAGSTVSRPDTVAHQAASPQYPAQQAGLGCPLARLLGGLWLARGSLGTRAVGPYRGQESGAPAW
jgi:hypothetical protein